MNFSPEPKKGRGKGPNRKLFSGIGIRRGFLFCLMFLPKIATDQRASAIIQRAHFFLKNALFCALFRGNRRSKTLFFAPPTCQHFARSIWRVFLSFLSCHPRSLHCHSRGGGDPGNARDAAKASYTNSRK